MDEKLSKLTRERPKAKKTRERFAKVKSLECLEPLNEKIKSGYPIPEIARWVQEDMMEYTDVSRDSLVTILSRYRNAMPPAQLVAPIPGVAVKAEARVMKGLDELDELEELYAVQKGRIRRYAALESQAPMPWNAVNKDIMLAATILVRRHEIKMDLGVGGGRNLGTLGIRPELQANVDKYGDDVKSAAKSAESKSRVLALAKSLVKVNEGAE